MSTQIQHPGKVSPNQTEKRLPFSEFGGRSTRSRAKQLGLSVEDNNSILISERSSAKRKKTKNIATISNENRKNDDSLIPVSLDETNNSFNISKRNLPKKAIKRRKRSEKVDDSIDVGTISHTKSTLLNATKTPEKKSTVLLPKISSNGITPEQTPQTSPVVVNLSPKRTSKTPKKSPKELASPKSHSNIPIGSAKIPRKLLLPIDSPTPQHNATIEKNEQETKMGLNTPNTKHNVSERDKSSRNSSGKKLKRNTSSMSLKHGIRRFSKSPKIVLKTPKPKSKKSKSPLKMKFPSKRYTISGNESRTPIKISKKISMPNTEPRKTTSTKTKKVTNSESSGEPVNANTLIQSPMLWNAMTLKQPVVVLHRLPLSDGKSPAKNISLLRVKEMTETAMHSPIISSAKGSPIDETVKSTHGSGSKSTPESSQRLFGKPTPKNLSLLKAESTGSQTSTPLKDGKKSSEPLMSSTPHDRIKRLGQLNTSDSASKLSQSNAAWEKINSSPGTAERTRSLIENISEPSLCLTDIMQGKSIGEIDGSIKENRDGTYELLEPKTPNLREKTRKRNSQDANLDSARDTKKNFKVRFAIPTVVIDSSSNVSIRRGENSQVEKVNTPKRSNPVRKSLFDSGSSNRKSPESLRERSNSVTNGSISKSSSSKKPRRSNSFPDQNGSMYTSLGSSAKKSESAIKNSATKKPPNFAKIHKKMFSKLESIVDANKRLHERHTKLTTAKAETPKASSSKATTLASEPTNGPYNRFGFKLRKKEATERLMQKTQLQTRKEQQQKKRDILKGVRMNRRFELQMKARNVKV